MDALRGAHNHSIFHRTEIEASDHCACFYCFSTFAPAEITEWVDEHDSRGSTAVCPRCGVDAVLGSASGLDLSEAFLRAMHVRWFTPITRKP